MLRPLFAALALTLGCSDDAPTTPDARYEERDAVVDPRDVTVSNDVPLDRAPTVDVVVFDSAPDASADVARDASAGGDLARPLDAPSPPCAELAEQYAAAVRTAATCGSSSECDVRVCETLCCACEVFVAASEVYLLALASLRTRADALGCAAMLPCPATRCPAATSGQCSSEGRCVTLREPVDASREP